MLSFNNIRTVRRLMFIVPLSQDKNMFILVQHPCAVWLVSIVLCLLFVTSHQIRYQCFVPKLKCQVDEVFCCCFVFVICFCFCFFFGGGGGVLLFLFVFVLFFDGFFLQLQYRKPEVTRISSKWQCGFCVCGLHMGLPVRSQDSSYETYLVLIDIVFTINWLQIGLNSDNVRSLYNVYPSIIAVIQMISFLNIDLIMVLEYVASKIILTE